MPAAMPSRASTPETQPLPVALVVSDVDGTLVTKEKKVTDDAKDAVRRLRECGIKFTITSSRPPRGLRRVISELQLAEPIAAFNGGMVVTPGDSRVIEQRLLREDAARECVRIIQEHSIGVWLYNQHDWFVRDRTGPHVQHEVGTSGFEPIVVESFDGHFDGMGKIVAVTDDFDAMQNCEDEVHARLGNLVSATLSQRYYLDITHPDANKGHGIATLSRVLGVPAEKIATIGDGQNDILMFQVSGLSIAMGNAAPDVQAAATYVTASNQEEGFARAMQQFILSRAEQAQ